MTYFPDLSPYIYQSNFAFKTSLNIGWLDSNETFQIGKTPSGFLKKIAALCAVSFVQTRGMHDCNFCNNKRTEFVRLACGKEVYFGSAEIRVIGENGKTYCAPNLIYHYIEKHNYLPPKEFIEAVMNGPSPEDEEYIVFFTKLGLKSSPTLTYTGQTKRRRFVKT